MRRLQLVVFAFLTALSLHGAIVPGPERPVAEPAIAPAHGAISLQAAVTDGSAFLTLWQDRTSGRAGIYATVLDSHGGPGRLAPEPVVRGGLVAARAAWTGNRYMVVFSEPGRPVGAMWLDREGDRIAGPVSVDIPGATWVLAMAWNGSRAFLVVTTATGLRGAIIGPSGEVVRSGIALPPKMTPWDFTLAAAGDSFILAWSEEHAPQQPGRGPLTSVSAMRIAPDGTPDPSSTLLEPREGFVQFDSASGRQAGVAFVSGLGTKWRIYRFTFDSAAAAPQAHPPLDIADTSSPELDVIATPFGFIATYLTSNRNTVMLGVLRFDLTAPHLIPLGTDSAAEKEVVANSFGVLVLAGQAPLVAAGFDPALTLRRSVMPVSLAPGARQSGPAIAPGGEGALVAWTEPIHGAQARVLARRFDRAGQPLDAQPLLLGTKATDAVPLAAAFTGRMWLVVWQQANMTDSRLLLRRIAADGTLLDEAPVDLGNAFEPVMASNGNVTVLLCSNVRNSETTIVRFSADGALLGTTAIRETSRAYQKSIGTNGQEFLFAWSAERDSVMGRRLDASGAPIDAAPIAIAAGPESEQVPRVASDGTDFVVVYTQSAPYQIVDPPIDPQEPSIVRVRSRRVLRNGALADFTAAQDGHLIAEKAMAPEIAWNGSRYVVTFLRTPGVTSPEEPQPLTLLAVTAGAAGAAMGELRTIARGETESTMHDLAMAGGSLWSAYSRLAPEVGNVQRVFMRMLAEGEPARRRTSRK